jgi:hypothetical protein
MMICVNCNASCVHDVNINSKHPFGSPSSIFGRERTARQLILIKIEFSNYYASRVQSTVFPAL